MKNSPGETGRSLFLTKKGPAQNAQDPSGLWVQRELVGRDVQESLFHPRSCASGKVQAS